MDRHHQQPTAVPGPALMLGGAGVLPFVLLTLAAWVEFAPLGRPPAWLLALYALAILSFMGAIHWGLAMARADGSTSGSATSGYLLSVVPALVGWFALGFLPMGPALSVMAASFALLLLYDFRAVRLGVAPAWYPVLRVPLTVVVVASLAVTALIS